MRKPPKGKWKVGDVATFGGLFGRVIALRSHQPGYPLCWVTTEPNDHYPDNKAGMLVRFDLSGKFMSWHIEPLLSFVRRATKVELEQLAANQAKLLKVDNEDGTISAAISNEVPREPT